MKNRKIKNLKKDQKELFKAVLELNDIGECERFLRDLCTPQELIDLAERWKVAKLIYQKMPYREIYEKTGVSTATVTRVGRALSYGEGYRLLLHRHLDS